MLKKNSFWLGLLIGIIFPVVLFGILYMVNMYTGVFQHSPVLLSTQKMMFVSAALNVLPIRYYFMHGGIEKTAQGILSVTVFLVLMIILAY
jgi:hypothetical protein